MSESISMAGTGSRRHGVAARLLVGWMCASLAAPPLHAADGARRAEFEQWQAAQFTEYKNWLSAQDKAFADALRKDWEAFQVQKPQRRDNAPKPVQPPAVPEAPAPVAPPKPMPPPKPVEPPKPVPAPLPPPKPVEPPKPVPAPLPPPKPVEPPKPVPAPLPPPKPVEPPKPVPAPLPPPKPVEPPKPAAPALPMGSKPVSLGILGAPLTVGVMPGLVASYAGSPSPKGIAEHFEKLASVPGTAALVDTLDSIARDHQLNSWGKLLLIDNLSSQLHPADATSRQLFTWFVALKCGYDARVGYSSTGVQLLLPFTSTVYGISYFEMDGKRFYLVDPGHRRATSPESMTTYRQSYEKTRVVDLAFSQAIKTRNTKPNARQITFSYRGQPQTLNLSTDPVLVGVLDSVPITDLSVYFASAWDSPLRDQLRAQLAPLLKGRSERDAVNFLLRFVQKGLAYKTDEEQFQRENYLFPDQTLFYPYSDCEDRSILFAALVQDLLGLQVIGVAYPGHVATAVLLPVAAKDDTLDHQGRRYVIADPTYLGADAGMAMPGMTAASAKAIDIAVPKSARL